MWTPRPQSLVTYIQRLLIRWGHRRSLSIYHRRSLSIYDKSKIMIRSEHSFTRLFWHVRKCDLVGEQNYSKHYCGVIMSAMASQITCVSIVCSAVCSGAGQRKHQSSASLAFVRGIQWWPVDSPHKGPVTQKMFPFDDVIVKWYKISIHELIDIDLQPQCVKVWISLPLESITKHQHVCKILNVSKISSKWDKLSSLYWQFMVNELAIIV